MHKKEVPSRGQTACGSVAEALKVFTAMPLRNVFSWTAMISAYAESRQNKEALTLFQQMHQADVEPDEVTYVIALKACTNIAALEQGKHLHSVILKKGFHSSVTVQTTLVSMYAKCRCLKNAHELFDNMTARNVVSWNAIIAGYAREGLGKEALDLYEQMKCEGIEPDIITLVLLLKACGSISALQQGKEIHSLILQRELDSKLIIQNTLIDMYSKCRCLKDARELFDNMTTRTLVSWNVMIAGYSQEGFGMEALDLYKQMKHEGLQPNNITLVLLLKACACISALQQGKQLHSIVVQKRLDSELMVQNALIDMYSKCGCLRNARELFGNLSDRDVVSWTSMIAAYTQEGLGKEALDLYEQMKLEGMEPNDVTLVLLLKACAGTSALHQGKTLHSLILAKGLESELIVQTTLVDMYSKCGCLKSARALFDNMTARNVVSWNAMIAGYAKEGFGKEALDLFQQMKDEGFQADDVTYTCVLSAYSRSGLGDEGGHVFESMSKGSCFTQYSNHCVYS